MTAPSPPPLQPLEPHQPHPHQTWAEIDLPSLRRNFRRFADQLPSRTKVILSVKKDAYGHGLVEVARGVEGDPRLSAFGVATVAEARRLRQNGVEAPVLCFSVLRGEDLRQAIGNGVILTVTDLADAREAAEAAVAQGVKIQAHMKIDTGMGRLGRLPLEAAGAAMGMARLPGLDLRAVYTHLADGWGDRAGARAQIEKLSCAADELRKAGLPELQSHIGGSDAFALSEEFEWDAARSGIAVYGYHPGIEGLEPAMSLKSRVIYRRALPVGSRVSYGGTHILRRDSELALVGAGYGNGYLRSLSNRTKVLINGRRCEVLGRVCMDQIVVDVTDAGAVRPGDEAVLFGRQGDSILGADEVAGWAETIPYELLVLAGGLNPRVYPAPPD